MPLYDFKFKTCGELFEVFQKWDDTSTECPKCKSNELEKLPVTSSLKFNGAGFYKEGFSSKIEK